MQGLHEGYAVRSDRGEAMKHLKSISDVYSPWRDADPVSEKPLPRNSDGIPTTVCLVKYHLTGNVYNARTAYLTLMTLTYVNYLPVGKRKEKIKQKSSLK